MFLILLLAKLLFKSTFVLLEFTLKLFLILLFLSLEVIDLFLEHLNVQFQLLFHFDVISDFTFVLLQLLFVFFGRQIQTLERRGKFASCAVVPAVGAAEASRLSCLIVSILVFVIFKFHLHQDFN